MATRLEDIIDNKDLIRDIGANAARLLANLLPAPNHWLELVRFNPPSSAEHLGPIAFQCAELRWFYIGFAGVEAPTSEAERLWVRNDTTGMEPE